MQKCIQLLSIENPSMLKKLSCYVHKVFDIRTNSVKFVAHKTMYLEKLQVSLSLTISVCLFLFLFSPNE